MAADRPRWRGRGVRRLGRAGPAPKISIRLTALYGAVFLVTGAVLLTIGYVLVANNLRAHHAFRSQLLHQFGIAPPVRPAFVFPFDSTGARFARAVQQQLVGDALHRLLVEYVVALGVMTMIAVGTGWLLADRALRPLRHITATARRVSGENLGERIGLQGPSDELKELADTFDGMLGRLDGAFASQRHFVANASHELRTPLAIIRTEVDVALADPDASALELREMGEAVRDTVDRCERLISSLLMLARSEASVGPEEPVDLASLAGDCITDLRARAHEKAVVVTADLDPAWTHGEPGLLERMIANLIDNGIRHNALGGHLEVTTRVRDGRVELLVANGGPTIDPGEAARLTEPFRRLDRSVEGFGLGLPIVSSVAHAHDGTVDVAAPPTGGLEVRVSLPALPAATDSPAVNVFVSRRSGALTRS
jgi:signal transduction histidine kinase